MEEKLPNLAAGKSLTYSSQLAMSSFHLLDSLLHFAARRRSALLLFTLPPSHPPPPITALTSPALTFTQAFFTYLITYILPLGLFVSDLHKPYDSRNQPEVISRAKSHIKVLVEPVPHGTHIKFQRHCGDTAASVNNGGSGSWP